MFKSCLEFFPRTTVIFFLTEKALKNMLKSLAYSGNICPHINDLNPLWHVLSSSRNEKSPPRINDLFVSFSHEDKIYADYFRGGKLVKF